MRCLRLLVVVCLFALVPMHAAQAQRIGPATDYVTWTVRSEPETVAPGKRAHVVFRAAIDDGWKMYALDSPPPSRGVSIAFDDLPEGLALEGDPQQEGNRSGYDPNFKKEVSYFETAADVWADVLVAPDVEAGVRSLSGSIHFMICNDRLCLPPTSVPFETRLAVKGEAATQSAAPPAAAGPPDAAAEAPAETGLPEPPSFTQDDAEINPAAPAPEASDEADQDAAEAPVAGNSSGGGLWGFLLLAVGAGLAALLTPCVFPMIPLTVSYFTKHSDDRSEAIRMATIYGLAIVVTFTGLGVLMAVLVGAAGAQSFAANPWVNLFIGVVFVIFALSLLGLFELRLPTGLVNFFNRKSNEQQGYLGVLFMGLTLTLVSFSCTAPFVGGLLAATTAGSWSYPVLGMVVFSATFSLPFVVFAMFPRALSSLPTSGSWMNAVKVVLGFVELAAAIKFLSNADLVWGWGVISRTLAIAVIVVIFFLAGLYLLGKLPLKHEPAPERVSVGRLLFAIGFFGLSLYMLPGLLGAPLNKLDAYLPPRQASDVSLLTPLQRATANGGTHDEDLWIVDDIDAAFAAAEEEGKPVLIDFTGYTCTNCRDMEANVFTRPEIAERFRRNFVLLRLYTDGPQHGSAFQRYQLQLTGTVALPTYAVVSPFSPKSPLVKISGVVPPDNFAAFLDKGTSSFLEDSVAVR